MEYRYRHIGKVKEGKLIYEDPSLLQRHLMSLEGEDVEVLVRKRRLPASSGQIGFYIGVVLKEAHKHEAFIHYDSPKAIHDQVMSPKFLEELVMSEGKLKLKKPHLNELDQDRMWDLTERVIAFLLMDFDIVIADKEKYHFK